MSDMVIHEVYFGKTKELLEIERLIGVMRDKYGPNSMDKKDGVLKNYMTKGKRKYSNSSPEILKINRLFEKAFGFDSFFLMIIHANIANAFTMPVSLCLDAPESTHKLKASLNGFKKTGGDKTLVCIFDGIFFNPDLTSAEVLGVILHEIGHNFQTAISPECRGFSYVDRIIQAIMIPVQIGSIVVNDDLSTKQKAITVGMVGITMPLIFNTTRKKIIDGYKQALEDRPEVIESIHSTNITISAIQGPIVVVKDIINIVRTLIRGLMPISVYTKIVSHNITNAILNSFDERGEIIADRFATAYGYGAECQSGLYKCKKKGYGMPSQEMIRKIPILNIYYDLINLPFLIIQNIIGCHPNDIFRTKDSLDYMRKELENEDLDPKLKAEMEAQVIKLEQNVKDLTNPKDMGFFFTNTWSATMLTLFNGDPKAVILGAGVGKDFDNAFERNLEIVKRVKEERG